VLANLLLLLPRRIGSAGLAVAVGALLLGCGLWLAGARFSRALLALALALGGGAIGFQSPQWLGWSVDPWSMAMLGALILGILAYFGHHYVQAVALGLVMAAWTALACVAGLGLDANWEWPQFSGHDPISSYAAALQQSLPTHLEIVLLYSAGLALIFGIAISTLFQQFGSVLFWSMLGTLLILSSAMTIVQSQQPDFLGRIPSQPIGQSVCLFILVAIGAGVQWKLTFAKKRPRKSPAPAQSPAMAG
jgi:hypothetical protein